MDPDLRQRFNAAWSDELHRTVRADLERRLGQPIPFPVAETPVFLTADLRDRFARASNEIMDLLSDPQFISAHTDAIPAEYRTPGRGHLPQLATIDFAIARAEDGTLVPRLVELQGFPSLFGFQLLLADVWATHLATMPGLPESWRLFFSGVDRYRGMALVRQALVAGHDPEQVILLDLEPDQQKTFPDFLVTRLWWGVDPVCPTELKRDGRRLFRVKEGRTIPVRRIYYRIVIDELERSPISLPFRFDEEIDVEWTPHPEWWWIWSKLSMLSLDHPSVPKTHLLSELEALPEDLSKWVLKPLWSFAGAGVNVDPTPADVAAVPADLRSAWVLQEKVDYAPAFQTVDGDDVKLEMRMMYVRPDDHERMTLLLNLMRLSRGKMMGVDYNKDLAWTGASVALWSA
jgi:hypothetical protein